jgi:hypothetical protein
MGNKAGQYQKVEGHVELVESAGQSHTQDVVLGIEKSGKYSKTRASKRIQVITDKQLFAAEINALQLQSSSEEERQ